MKYIRKVAQTPLIDRAEVQDTIQSTSTTNAPSIRAVKSAIDNINTSINGINEDLVNIRGDITNQVVCLSLSGEELTIDTPIPLDTPTFVTWDSILNIDRWHDWYMMFCSVEANHSEYGIKVLSSSITGGSSGGASVGSVSLELLSENNAIMNPANLYLTCTLIGIATV